MTRIVAGIAGGRRIDVPKGRGTRPTSDRTREGLFSSLVATHGTLHGLAFLDLYAGSGAVGLEAASRGATPVLLVESNAAALAAIRRNVDALALDAVEVRPLPVEQALGEQATRSFDVVFMDPPYAAAVDPPLTRLVENGWLAPGATVVVERSTRGPEMTWPAGIEADRCRRYGDSTLWYGRRS